MKKYSLLLLIICSIILASPGHAQNEYYDALQLKAELTAGGTWTVDDPDVAKILNKYIDLDSGETIKSELMIGHPFLASFLIPWNASADPTGLDLSSLPNIGNLNITNLADGFAKFLVKRTKEELNAAFFSKFADLISRPEYQDARQLFPQTYSTLSAISSQVYNYASYLNVLRESFQKDLDNLLPNMKRVVEDGRYASFFTSHPELKAVCLTSIFIGQEFKSKAHPGEMIRDYPAGEYLSAPGLINAKASVQALQLFSEAIRSKDPSRYWISSDSLKMLVNDRTTLTIFLGLIYQKAEVISFRGQSMRAIMKSASQTAAEADNFLKAMRSFLSGLQSHTEAVVLSIRNLKEKDVEKHEFSDYYAVYSYTLDVIEHILRLNVVPGFNTQLPDDLSKIREKITALRAGGDMALDLTNGNFSSSIVDLFTLYAAVMPETSSERMNPFILKYGGFMAAVVQAENSDEVAAAIEAIVLPSGSARIKRETPFNVSLNGYVGIFSGFEKINGIDDEFEVNSYGVTAPVGLSISLGKQKAFPFPSVKNFKGHWSWSAFVSIVDLGAITAFRFSSDSTETIPTVQLKDIVSPGIFFSLGIPKSPLSVNFGWQMGPILRKITATAEHDEHYSRLSLSLCVDIPLLNFYTHSGRN